MTVKLLTKQQINASKDLKSEIVEVKEWGIKVGNEFVQHVKVVELMCKEKSAYEASMLDFDTQKVRRDVGDFRSRLLGLTLVDEQNNRLFTDKEIEELGKKSATVMDRIYDVAAKLSGLTKEKEDELVKNSTGQDGN